MPDIEEMRTVIFEYHFSDAIDEGMDQADAAFAVAVFVNELTDSEVETIYKSLTGE